MKKIILYTVLTAMTLGCDKAASSDGWVSGTVKDNKGQPLKNVDIIIDNSIFFNSNISTKTDAEGRYKVKVPVGSWYAFAQHKVAYQGKTYTLYLHPDNNSGFGGEGAVRNFVWKLEGEKAAPLTGTYGALITFDNYPGVYLEEENEIVFRLEPVGNLIDGSTGHTFTVQSSDRYQLSDIPIGRYRISATYRGRGLQLRKWNTDDAFAGTITVDIEPRIEGQCDNCAMLEYRD